MTFKRIVNSQMLSRRLIMSIAAACFVFVATANVSVAEPPHVSYIFPAGGQRGTTVPFIVGGHYLYEGCPFEMRGAGIEVSTRVERGETEWFEGPFLPKPFSQRAEDYPKNYHGEVKIANDSARGVRYWQAWNSQGATLAKKFVIGQLPEIVEQEIDGRPIPTAVTLPVTINGRMFPREDVDIWTFDARAGETFTCEVNAARIGSPLDSRLEIRGPGGNRVTENDDAFGSDSLVRFTAEEDGTYRVHIHDVAFGGLQHYVYRLTITSGAYIDAVYPLGGRRGSTTSFELLGANITERNVSVALPAEDQETFAFRGTDQQPAVNQILIDVDDLPELVEDDVRQAGSALEVVELPAALNGRVSSPGEHDDWMFSAVTDTEYEFDLFASRLGSPLDSVLAILDSAGKQLATADDISSGETDSRLVWKAPADGIFTLRVRERLASRGGERFAYRLKVRENDSVPDFRIDLPVNALTIERGKETKLKITAERLGGFQGTIELSFSALPEGVSVENTKIAEGKNEVEIVLKATETAPIQAARATLTGKSVIGDVETTHQAVQKAARGEQPVDSLLLATTLPTPFRLRAQFEQKFAARGSVYAREYTIERNGFEGPIEISLADRQVRHAQGVSGPLMTIPIGVSEFIYPLMLSPFMEIGRTSRTNLMAVGVVTDEDGSEHKVSFTTFDVDEQVITLTDPGRISVSSSRKSLRARPGETVRLPVEVGRATGLKGEVTIELRIPRHIRGVSAENVTVPTDATRVELPIRFDADSLGPFNMPLRIRATMSDARGHPLIAETDLAVVDAR